MKAFILAAVLPLKIQDNSFLIEEAYNQEPGVIQYINTFVADDGEWFYTFTNEIPIQSQKHQFSYTLAVNDGDFGDSLLNYRYQLVGDGNSRLAIAPRLSAVVPTGEGSDDWGISVNLPVSYAISDRVVTHWNAGFTEVAGIEWFAGACVIAAPREKFHVMLEALWSEDEEFVVSPGVRWAWDLKNGFQIVPGVAFPIGEETRAVFLYLSLER